MQIIVHYPSNENDKSEISQILAELHSKNVFEKVQSLPCSKSEKLQLINKIIDVYQKKS